MATEILCAILIVLFPLSAYIVQAFFGKNLPRMGDWVSISAIAISFLLALRIFISMASSNDPNWGGQCSLDVGGSGNL